MPILRGLTGEKYAQIKLRTTMPSLRLLLVSDRLCPCIRTPVRKTENVFSPSWDQRRLCPEIPPAVLRPPWSPTHQCAGLGLLISTPACSPCQHISPCFSSHSPFGVFPMNVTLQVVPSTSFLKIARSFKERSTYKH